MQAAIHELVRLRDNAALQQLLSHYAEAGVADPDRWHGRVMHLPGVEPRALARLHGELIAHEWIEQNTGHAAAKDGTVTECYRVTEAGIRALKQVLGGLVAPDDVLAGIAARVVMKKTRPRSRRPRARRKAAEPGSAG